MMRPLKKSTAVRILLSLMISGVSSLALADRARPAESTDIGYVEALIVQLGSPHFSEREAASVLLTEVGEPALPQLKAAIQHPDAEVRHRAGIIFKQVSEDWFEEQAEKFIAGNDQTGAFKGWSVAKRLMGDTESIRALFVSISRRYPELVEALEQPLDKRTVAAERVADQSRQRQMELIDPTIDDLAAMLLVAADGPVELSESFNLRVIQLIQHHAFNEEMRRQLGEPLRKLTNAWMLASPKNIRFEVLRLTRQQRFPIGAELARLSLDATAPLETLHEAVVVLAEFGRGKDYVHLLPLLKDSREIWREENLGALGLQPLPKKEQEPEPATTKYVVTQVRDLALAGALRMLGVDLQEAGFPFAQPHSRLDDLPALAFADSEDATRAAPRKRLDRLLEEKKDSAP